MRKISVDIRGVKVASFSASKEDVSFAVSFNDGKEKEITKNMKVSKGEDAALAVVRDIRNVEARLNAEFDGRAVLDSHTSIIIKDEEKVTERLAMFFSKVFEKVKVIKNRTSADGYISLVNQVNGMKVDF